ncbi:MAG: peptidase MA family metallohydrolase [Chloroflexota bacterium]
MLAFLFLLALAPVALAQEPIRVVSQSTTHAFGESLTFRLQAQSASPIDDLVLFYGRVGQPIVRRIYPEFSSDKALTVTHTEELERGQFAPGTRLRIYWRLHASDGSTLTTPEQYLDYAHDAHAWKRLEGQRADLYWYGNTSDGQRARDLLEKGEQAIGRLERELGVAVSERVQIYAYNAQRDMLPALSSRSDSYDERVLTLGVAVDEHTLLLLGTHRDVQQTVAHELSHIVVGIATDNPYMELPRWLDEGLAMYAEAELPRDNRQALDQAVRNDVLLSVRSMTSYAGKAELVDLYYGQAYSIVAFMLNEFGRDQMTALLSAFAEGVPQEDALQRTYGFGLDELDTRWRASLGLGPRRPRTSQNPLADAVSQASRRPRAGGVCSATGVALLPAVGAVWLGRRRTPRTSA